MKKIDYVTLLQSALTDSGKLGEYYRYFHNYSFGNQLLLYFQGVTTPVATFKRWGELGRRVKKGSKAKEMFIHVKWNKEIEDRQTGEINSVSIPGFLLKKLWFQLSDTEGEEYYSESKALPEIDKFKLLSNLGITEQAWKSINGNSQGYAYSTEKVIAINPLAKYPYKTLLHEVAHCILHGSDNLMSNHDIELPQNLREVEAESVAYITGCYLGILSEEAMQVSRGYIQHWIKNDNVPEKNARRIFGAVDKIIKALETGIETK